MDITSRRPRVLFAGRELEFDAVIPRIGASYTFYGTAVVRQFEMMHVLTANESQAISRARDKLRSLQLLARAGIGLPVTSFAHSIKDISGLLDVVGKPPYVIKLLEGTQGVGVVLAPTLKAAESVIAAFRQLDANILVQRFVSEAKNTDLRAFVVGGKVVAAMERVAAEGEFRANLHRGGTARAVALTEDETETALTAAATLGLDLSGVDMLRSDEGPLVIEVNSSPGLEGIEAASGVDVAGAVIEYLEKRFHPPPEEE
jgi:ribosomal protein S6--L-glutamate ligase